MCQLTLQLKQQGVSLIFIKENIHFSATENSPLQELQLHMMSAFSQFERALIRERQAEGIAAKKRRGEKTKWYLWHGNVEKALDQLDNCLCLCDDAETHNKNSKKMGRYLDEMMTYIENLPSQKRILKN
ncbi:recombinase family protein [Photorhabdus kleinii]|uniref:recombinase family protein n=1 Tax=Photorhabdus kleinii TaxID=768034 RepID=UPI0021D49235|nr:recombinase family protein [Photorhabdus kleinii]